MSVSTVLIISAIVTIIIGLASFILGSINGKYSVEKSITKIVDQKENQYYKDFVQEKVCNIYVANIHNDITEIKKDIKALLKANGIGV